MICGEPHNLHADSYCQDSVHCMAPIYCIFSVECLWHVPENRVVKGASVCQRQGAPPLNDRQMAANISCADLSFVHGFLLPRSSALCGLRLAGLHYRVCNSAFKGRRVQGLCRGRPQGCGPAASQRGAGTRPYSGANPSFCRQNNVQKWLQSAHDLILVFKKMKQPTPQAMATELKDRLLEFQRYLPLVQCLRNPGIRERCCPSLAPQASSELRKNSRPCLP